jgi:hypothetical protein
MDASVHFTSDIYVPLGESRRVRDTYTTAAYSSGTIVAAGEVGSFPRSGIDSMFIVPVRFV